MEENENIEKLDPRIERVKAVATLVVVAVVNILNVYGYAVEAAPWLNLVGSIAAAASVLYAWWKNQNVTDEATEAQELLNALKAKHAKDDGIDEYEG